MAIELTEDDKVSLASLEHKQRHIENAIVSLAKGHDTAVFLWGEGGTGKSFTCDRKLHELKASFMQHNSRMTGRGLVDALHAAPQSIHWIEDAETLLDDKKAIGVLRSACWSQSRAVPKVRPITWTAYRTQIRFEFTGALLVVSNAPLLELAPEISALQTRVKVLRMDVSPAEVLALVKTICQRGYQVGQFWVSPSECWTVARFVKDRLSLLERPLDLRLVLLSFHDYVLARDHRATLRWEELVEARMAGSPTKFKTPKQKAIEEVILARTIYGKKCSQAEKLSEWQDKTGKNRASFYNAINRKLV